MNDDGMHIEQFADEIDRDLAEGRVLELAEVYALDAVSEEERADIDEYVSAAPQTLRHSFEERVRQAREALAATYAVEEEPPAALLAQIMDNLPNQETSGPAVPAPPQGGAAGPQAVDDLTARREQKARRRGLGTGPRWIVGVAAAALIAIGGVAVGSSVLSSQDPVHQILSASDIQTRKLSIPGGGAATLAISTSKDAAVVTMQAVPAPPPGKVYQMWLIPKSGAAPVSQGTMDAQALSRRPPLRASMRPRPSPSPWSPPAVPPHRPCQPSLR